MHDLSSNLLMGEVEAIQADAQAEIEPALYITSPEDVIVLTQKTKALWKSVHLATQGSRALLMERWVRIMNGFFFSELPDNVGVFFQLMYIFSHSPTRT